MDNPKSTHTQTIKMDSMGYISVFVHTYIQAHMYILSMCNNKENRCQLILMGGDIREVKEKVPRKD